MDMSKDAPERVEFKLKPENKEFGGFGGLIMFFGQITS
jgi:hypothetical protein